MKKKIKSLFISTLCLSTVILVGTYKQAEALGTGFAIEGSVPSSMEYVISTNELRFNSLEPGGQSFSDTMSIGVKTNVDYNIYAIVDTFTYYDTAASMSVYGENYTVPSNMFNVKVNGEEKALASKDKVYYNINGDVLTGKFLGSDVANSVPNNTNKSLIYTGTPTPYNSINFNYGVYMPWNMAAGTYRGGVELEILPATGTTFDREGSL